MPDPTLSNFAGIDYRNLSKEESSPLLSLRRDAATCSRLYSCAWIDAFDFAVALRGKCTINDLPISTSSRYNRQAPDYFTWGNSLQPFVCMDVQQLKPAGLRTNADGSFNTNELDTMPELIVAADKAHFQVDYAAVRFPLAEDDETNEAIAAGDQTATSLTYNEWDRYCDWTREWGVETLTAPIGAYKYVNYNQPINSYIQFQQQVATITCKVYGLPQIPPAVDAYAGCVNHKSMRIFLDQDTTFFTAAAETLLFQPPAVEFCYNADLSVCYNLIYRFIYRPQKHNFFFYYPGNTGSGSGSGSGAGLRWSWQRIALDTTSPTADGSAPFSLRNFGYLWSPQTPP